MEQSKQESGGAGERGEKEWLEWPLDGDGAPFPILHQALRLANGERIAFHQIAQVFEAWNRADRADRRATNGELLQCTAVQPGTRKNHRLAPPGNWGRY